MLFFLEKKIETEGKQEEKNETEETMRKRQVGPHLFSFIIFGGIFVNDAMPRAVSLAFFRWDWVMVFLTGG